MGPHNSHIVIVAIKKKIEVFLHKYMFMKVGSLNFDEIFMQ